MAETAHTGSQGPSSSGTSAGGEMKDQAQEKAQEVKEQAKQQAQQVAGQARDQIRSQVDQRSTQAGQQIKQQANDMRSVSEQLRNQGKEGPAKMTDQVADRVQNVGTWLANSDADRILHDIEDFGRRQPWAVMAGGAALGFLASRFLKASSRDRYDRRGLGPQYRTGYTNELYGQHELPERTSPERFTRAGSSGDM